MATKPKAVKPVKVPQYLVTSRAIGAKQKQVRVLFTDGSEGFISKDKLPADLPIADAQSVERSRDTFVVSHVTLAVLACGPSILDL